MKLFGKECVATNLDALEGSMLSGCLTDRRQYVIEIKRCSQGPGSSLLILAADTVPEH